MSEVRRGYKQTEVGVIPDEWETRSCSDVSDLITVGIVIRPTQYYVPRGVPALRSANVREEGVDENELVFISERANALLSKSQVRAGDVLTVRTGYPGTSAVVPQHLSGANCIDILITRPSKAMDSRYLAAWINSPLGKYQVLRNQGGLAQQHFNVGGLRELIVALPPTTTEQEAIAEALSDADTLIESLKQLLTKKRQIKQGAMQDLLTGKKRLPGFQSKLGYKQTEVGKIPEDWTPVPFGRLFTFCNGVNADKAAYGTGVPFVNVLEIINSTHLQVAHVPGRISLERSRIDTYAVRRGDVLFNRTSETQEEVGLGSVYIGDDEVVFGGFVIRGRPMQDSALNENYLGFALRSPAVRVQIISRGQGAIRANVGQADLKDVLFPRPALAEQTAIASVLSDMDSELSLIETKLAKSRQVKQGMMQELLTGRIRLV